MVSPVQVIANRHCAFVTYAERSAAERAVDELQHKLIVRGQRCKLMWGKPQEKRAPIEARDPAGADMLPSGPPPSSMIPPQVCRPSMLDREWAQSQLCHTVRAGPDGKA